MSDAPEATETATQAAPEPQPGDTADAARDALIAEVEAEERGEAPAEAGTESETAETTAAASANPPADASAEGEGATAEPATGATPAADAEPEATDPDPWADAPEAAKAEYARAEHARRTAEGRLASVERRLAELTAAPAEPTPTETAAPADPSAAEAAFAKFAEDYPDVAEGVRPLMDLIRAENADLRNRLDGATESLRTLGEDRLHTAYVDAEAQVIAAHPEYAEIASETKNERNEDFIAWYRDQAPGIRRIVEENGETVQSAEDVNYVLGLWKRDRGMVNGEAANGEAANGAAAADTARRAIQRNGARGAPRPSPGARVPEDATGAPQTREEIIREIEAEERRLAAAMH